MEAQVLNELVHSLELGGAADTSKQQECTRRLEQLKAHPEFVLYLLYVFATADYEILLRQRAGLFLKQFMKVAQVSQANTEKVMQQLSQSVRDPIRVIRETSGTVLTFVIQQRAGFAAGFPTLRTLTADLMTAAQGGELDCLDGYFSTLTKVAEDACDAIKTFRQNATNAVPGAVVPLSQEQTDFLSFSSSDLLPKIFNFGTLEAPRECRFYAIKLVNHFALSYLFEDPQAWPAGAELLQPYFQMVGSLACDTDPDVLSEVVKGMAHLVHSASGHTLIGDQIDVVLNFMLKNAGHSVEKIRLDASDFWSSVTHYEPYLPEIEKKLPELVPILLRNMQYSETDYLNMNDANDDTGERDHAQDIEPRFHTERNHGDEDDAEGKKESSWGAEWTTRKASAASLDALACRYGQRLLTIALPIISANLSNQTDFEVQESAVLAIGAIAGGCMHLLSNDLPQLMAHLVHKIQNQNQQPLMKSICCWCLSRYGSWICESTDKDMLPAVLKPIMICILDRSKRVQEAACTAFATLCEVGRSFAEYMVDIVACLNKAFQTYQSRNLYQLFDAVGAFVGNVRYELRVNPEQCLHPLLQPIAVKFQNTNPQDKLTIALFECLMIMVAELGQDFTVQFASSVIQRCEVIITGSLQREELYAKQQAILNTASAAQTASVNSKELIDRPDRDILGTSIDMISSIIDGFGPSVDAIVKERNFVNLLPLILTANEGKGYHHGTHQCGFALMGECARFCIEQLKPHLPVLFPICQKNLVHFSPAVSNNAGWAVGEICEKVPPELVRPFLEGLGKALIQSLEQGSYQDQTTNPYVTNTCITLGRLGNLLPNELGVVFPQFVDRWLFFMKNATPDGEKVKAFTGLCKLIEAAPQTLISQSQWNNQNAAVGSLMLFCLAVATFPGPNGSINQIPAELRGAFRTILMGYKGQMDGGVWDNMFLRIQPTQLQAILDNYYLK